MGPTHYLDEGMIRPSSSAVQRLAFAAQKQPPLPLSQGPPPVEGADTPRNELCPPDGLDWAFAEVPHLGRVVQLTRHDIRMGDRNAVVRLNDRWTRVDAISPEERADFVKGGAQFLSGQVVRGLG
ncbi:unnamed protein product [Prorocentrum cordatum]|uniref:Uncharacterized protein n=1 Tax=Prorocentrum cordatum TaxID=2364126 RepID=A0ABN9SZK5_9DINO|nr:unnamed protein product [Polarella glacialis]